MNRSRVAIIGGGPGGLMTAYLLQKDAHAPDEITLFEAGPRLGGKILTQQFATSPQSYEAGAAELYDYSQLGPDPLRQLIAELHLTTSPMEGWAVVLRNHIINDLSDVRRAFGDATYRALKRFRRRARAAISPAEYYESDWKQDNEDIFSRRSFHALLNTIPDVRAREFIRIAVHSDLATEPHQTTAMYGLQNYLMNEDDYMQLYTIDGGNERLPQELAKRLTARIRLNHPVLRVEKTANNRYRVFARHAGRVIAEEFDYVVAALPNNWLPAIEWGGETLAEAMHGHHAHYDHPAHYLRISALFKTPFWRKKIEGAYFMLDAFGGCCAYDESARAGNGTAHGVLAWLLGGEAAETMSNFDDEVLIANVLDSLPPILGDAKSQFLEARIHRWVGSVNGLPMGYPAKSPEVRHQPEPVEHPGLYVVGDYLFDSTLNGVLDSAEFVADKITETLRFRSVPAPVFPMTGNVVSTNGQVGGIVAAAP